MVKAGNASTRQWRKCHLSEAVKKVCYGDNRKRMDLGCAMYDYMYFME